MRSTTLPCPLEALPCVLSYSVPVEPPEQVVLFPTERTLHINSHRDDDVKCLIPGTLKCCFSGREVLQQCVLTVSPPKPNVKTCQKGYKTGEKLFLLPLLPDYEKPFLPSVTSHQPLLSWFSVTISKSKQGIVPLLRTCQFPSLEH